jgi:hypothetical protein
MLRWKKHPRETGLSAIGAGPRPSTLHDGKTEYATVYAHGGNWSMPLRGWYWVCSPREGIGGYKNTCNDLAPDEATAKARAMAYVKAALAKRA